VIVSDPAGRLLMVQEEKPDVRGLWNLPGGRLEPRESGPQGAVRELEEETGLRVELAYLQGIYCSRAGMRFVFRAAAAVGEPRAGHEILAVRWVGRADLDAMDDSEITVPAQFRAIVRDWRAGVAHPMSLFVPT
jgi:8-oxo-dGTP pyrophosphatase MutT (NUDIX family)